MIRGPRSWRGRRRPRQTWAAVRPSWQTHRRPPPRPPRRCASIPRPSTTRAIVTSGSLKQVGLQVVAQLHHPLRRCHHQDRHAPLALLLLHQWLNHLPLQPRPLLGWERAMIMNQRFLPIQFLGHRSKDFTRGVSYIVDDVALVLLVGTACLR